MSNQAPPLSARGGQAALLGRASVDKDKGSIDVDSIVVGGGNKADFHEYEDEYARGGGGVGGGRASKMDNRSMNGRASAEDMDDDIMKRPIQPKSVDYGAVGDQEDEVAAYTGEAVERFAPGEHPLEGVSNFSDLPTPEQLTGKAKYVTSLSVSNPPS
jgi:hypothetical protein